MNQAALPLRRSLKELLLADGKPEAFRKGSGKAASPFMNSFQWPFVTLVIGDYPQFRTMCLRLSTLFWLDEACFLCPVSM